MPIFKDSLVFYREIINLINVSNPSDFELLSSRVWIIILTNLLY
jgi:hypothetical protein